MFLGPLEGVRLGLDLRAASNLKVVLRVSPGNLLAALVAASAGRPQAFPAFSGAATWPAPSGDGALLDIMHPCDCHRETARDGPGYKSLPQLHAPAGGAGLPRGDEPRNACLDSDSFPVLTRTMVSAALSSPAGRGNSADTRSLITYASPGVNAATWPTAAASWQGYPETQAQPASVGIRQKKAKSERLSRQPHQS